LSGKRISAIIPILQLHSIGTVIIIPGASMIRIVKGKIKISLTL
jgi:hypothetical protein